MKSEKGYVQHMSKIGVIGSRGEVMTFLAAGFTVYEARDCEEAAKILPAAAAECAVLFLTPVYAEALAEEIRAYDGMVTPAILSLPEKDGGAGMRNLKKYVERAVGADILFRDS